MHDARFKDFSSALLHCVHHLWISKQLRYSGTIDTPERVAFLASTRNKAPADGKPARYLRPVAALDGHKYPTAVSSSGIFCDVFHTATNTEPCPFSVCLNARTAL